MAREWKARPSPQPTTITEICRRYYACALALSKVMGVPLTETFMQAHHSAISSAFIETSRCELRLPPGVRLPALVPPNSHGALQPEASNRAIAAAIGGHPSTIDRDVLDAAHPAFTDNEINGIGEHAAAHAAPDEPEGDDEEDEPDDKTTVPTSIPSDGNLPCAGQEIATLKPAALAMLIAKTATLAHAHGAGWAPLLAALTREREARLARGQRPRAVTDAPG